MSDLSFQVRAPLGLELVTGETITITQWSLEGFEFPTEIDVMPKEAVLSIPFQGVDIRFPVTLSAETGSRFCAFTGLTGRQRETMAVFYRSILSGRMASTEDVITSLDTPVDLVPMGETEEEEEAGKAGKSPRALRAAMALSIYACLAIAVFWTIGLGIYSKLATVDINNARIEAPLVPHLAPDTAFVKEITAAVGQQVDAGDVLVRLVDPETEAALTDVRARIALLERRAEAAQSKAALLSDEITALRDQRLAALRASPDETGVDMIAALAQFDAGLTPALRALFEARGAVLREIDGIEDELRRLRRERGRLRDAGDSLFVVAAEPGLVTDIHVIGGQRVARGAPVAELEGTASRTARGWVDQSMAAAFYPGMDVRVAVNTGQGRQTLRGQVLGLEAGIDPEISPEFGMLVAVDFPDLSAAKTRAQLPHLMPVVLQARRGWAVQMSERWKALKDTFRG